MWRETNVLGIFLPPMIVYALCALAAYVPLRMLLTRLGLFRWTWNTPLAEAAIYTCILGILVRWL